MKSVKTLLVVLALLVTAFIVFWGVDQSGYLSSISSDGEWKTYSLEDYHLSFKYPPDWFLEKIPGGTVDGIYLSNYPFDRVGNKPVPADFFKMSLVVHLDMPLAAAQSLDDWVKIQPFYGSQQMKSSKSIMVAGQEAREIEIEQLPDVILPSIFLVIEDSGIGKVIMSIGHGQFIEPDLETVFRQIVATIQFEK